MQQSNEQSFWAFVYIDSMYVTFFLLDSDNSSNV